MAIASNLRLFWEYLCLRKRWWLTPIVLFLLLVGFLIVLLEGAATNPWIYALF